MELKDIAVGQRVKLRYSFGYRGYQFGFHPAGAEGVVTRWHTNVDGRTTVVLDMGKTPAFGVDIRELIYVGDE